VIQTLLNARACVFDEDANGMTVLMSTVCAGKHNSESVIARNISLILSAALEQARELPSSIKR